MSEITEEKLNEMGRWAEREDGIAHAPPMLHQQIRALIAAIREQRAEVVEWEARYGAACRDIGKLSFMRDSDKALHEAAEAEVNRLKAEKLHLIRQLQSIARHSAEHGTKSRVSVALSEVNYD